MNGEHKITSGHRARTALVYLRQSTLVQVREHAESTIRQYALAGVAVSLGWAPRDVEVIDRDLGLPGTSATHRQGFRELMSRVCLGEVGAVLGLEVSRLARSNADLARLAEMARLTGTLLIDSDGVYDLSDFNDWLVLGRAGTLRGRPRRAGLDPRRARRGSRGPGPGCRRGEPAPFRVVRQRSAVARRSAPNW